MPLYIFLIPNPKRFLEVYVKISLYNRKHCVDVGVPTSWAGRTEKSSTDRVIILLRGEGRVAGWGREIMPKHDFMSIMSNFLRPLRREETRQRLVGVCTRSRGTKYRRIIIPVMPGTPTPGQEPG